MSFARVLLAQPRFVLIENPGNDLDPDKAGELLRMLTGRGTTYLTFGRHGQRDGDEPIERYDAVLELKPQGRWSWKDNGRRLLGPGDRPLTPQAPPP